LEGRAAVLTEALGIVAFPRFDPAFYAGWLALTLSRRPIAITLAPHLPIALRLCGGIAEPAYGSGAKRAEREEAQRAAPRDTPER
jgi:hypothetical protein